MTPQERIGYTSISLKGLKEPIDALSVEMGLENRSETIRMIIKKYLDLKNKGIDILKMDEESLKKEL